MRRNITIFSFRPKIFKLDPSISASILKKQFLQNFLSIVICEGGYSLDPRLVAQEKLSTLEETQMIMAWENIRKGEKEFCDKIEKINDENRIIENKIKSEKDFSETVMLFLTEPEKLEDSCPKRFEFSKKWLDKQFPEEKFTETKQFGNYSYSLRATKLNRQYNEFLEEL